MKISWTFAIAAVALVVGAFPAFANQAAQPARKSPANEKTARQIKAAATTKYVTDRQASNVQKVVDGADTRTMDEQTAYPEPGQAAPASQEVAPGQPIDPNQVAPAQPQPAPSKPEPEKPQYRFMGTVCGYGDDIAMFDNGGATPIILRVGDKLVDGTEITAIERGCIGLLQMRPAEKQGAKPTENRFFLYAW